MAIGLLSLAMARPAGAAQPASANTASAESEASSADAGSTPTQLVDALNLVFGKQTDNRAVHAKGIVLHGRFLPSSAAADLSRAPHFQKNAVPLTVRFSDFAGIPTIPDNHGLANPRGLALKFKLPDGTDTDLVTHSFNGFPSPTADDFRQLLIALGTSGPGVGPPTPADTYLAAHPLAKTFLETQKLPPVSYGTLSYYGVNTFKFTNAHGVARYGRYRIIPLAGEQLLTVEQAKQAPPGYLADEIRQRAARAPVRFRMLVQLAEDGDKLEDPSIAWPESRATIEVGVIETVVATLERTAPLVHQQAHELQAPALAAGEVGHERPLAIADEAETLTQLRGGHLATVAERLRKRWARLAGAWPLTSEMSGYAGAATRLSAA